jgi:hypothetical protein
MPSNIQYLLYVDNLPTKAIHDTLSETQASARDYLEEKKPLMITTVNSPYPVQTWNFDYALKMWIEKNKCHKTII